MQWIEEFLFGKPMLRPLRGMTDRRTRADEWPLSRECLHAWEASRMSLVGTFETTLTEGSMAAIRDEPRSITVVANDGLGLRIQPVNAPSNL